MRLRSLRHAALRRRRSRAHRKDHPGPAQWCQSTVDGERSTTFSAPTVWLPCAAGIAARHPVRRHRRYGRRVLPPLLPFCHPTRFPTTMPTMPTTAPDIPQAIRDSEAEMRALRHRIHAHPELAYEEFATSDTVAECPQRLGLHGDARPRRHGPGGHAARRQRHARTRAACRHGCAADPRGVRQTLCQHHRRQDARLRTRRPHRHPAGSRQAQPAATRRFDGTVHLIFQPAEEGRPARAR